MSDRRRLTDPKLRIKGRLGQETGEHAGSKFQALADGVCDLLRCRRRGKEWIAYENDRPDDRPAVIAVKDQITHGKRKHRKDYEKEWRARESENEAEELDFSWLTCSSSTDAFTVLLAFQQDDLQCAIIGRVARKIGWSVTEAWKIDDALQSTKITRPDLVIVDRREPHRDAVADDICRQLASQSYSNTFTVALVKKSFFTHPKKKDDAVLQLLKIGYKRAMLECSHEGILTNELVSIQSCRVPRPQRSAARLLQRALDKSRDLVIATNKHFVILFATSTSVKSLGYTKEELLDNELGDFVTSESFAMVEKSFRRGREFIGQITWKRKQKSMLLMSCRAAAVSLPARNTENYVFYLDYENAVESISDKTNFEHYSPRESIQSVIGRLELRGLNNTRRSTHGKLSDLPLESPITKVVSVLTNALKICKSADVVVEIEKAIEMLKNAELYSPHLKEGDPLAIADPVTADLIGALISVSTKDHHKASLIGRPSQILKILNQNSIPEKVIALANSQKSQELDSLLETSFEWHFDIFKLETLTDRRPLFYLGMTLMGEFKVAERLGCDERTLQNWLTIIEANYSLNVVYHNSTHATDVLQAIARFMRSKRLQAILEPLDEVAALLAAAAHDVGHPGKSSQFLCNANNKLAILYNDLTVLESHHSALTFKLTLSDDNVNILKNLNTDVYKFMRQNIIDMILATEMTKHFEHLAKFVNVCSSRIDDGEEINGESEALSIFLLPENVIMAKRMMIKCADVSNPTRPMRLYMEWTRRIAEEYFDQTDEEKKESMPVVMPMFDRTTCSIPKSQIGFVDYIINDMMEAWDAFIDMPEMIGNMRQNYEIWKRFEEQGITKLDDIKHIQKRSPEYQLYKKSTT